MHFSVLLWCDPLQAIDDDGHFPVGPTVGKGSHSNIDQCQISWLSYHMHYRGEIFIRDDPILFRP